jgi:hypothetical protein
LLEISIVSIPADTGALVTERAFKGTAMSKHLIRARECVDEAVQHHDTIRSCYDRGDDDGMMRAHRALGRFIREAQRCFRSADDEAVLDDIHNSQQLQTSAGVTPGTSDSGRSFAARQRDLAALTPRLPVLDGTCIGVFELRNYEFERARRHIEAAARAGAFRRDRSRAEGQAEADRQRRI